MIDNLPMTARSMFAIYLFEDSEGNVMVRADSYGLGEKAMSLGMDILEELTGFSQMSGGEHLLMLPIDRCETVQCFEQALTEPKQANPVMRVVRILPNLVADPVWPANLFGHSFPCPALIVVRNN